MRADVDDAGDDALFKERCDDGLHRLHCLHVVLGRSRSEGPRMTAELIALGGRKRGADLGSPHEANQSVVMQPELIDDPLGVQAELDGEAADAGARQGKLLFQLGLAVELADLRMSIDALADLLDGVLGWIVQVHLDVDDAPGDLDELVDRHNVAIGHSCYCSFCVGNESHLDLIESVPVVCVSELFFKLRCVGSPTEGACELLESVFKPVVCLSPGIGVKDKLAARHDVAEVQVTSILLVDANANGRRFRRVDDELVEDFDNHGEAFGGLGGHFIAAALNQVANSVSQGGAVGSLCLDHLVGQISRAEEEFPCERAGKGPRSDRDTIVVRGECGVTISSC